MPLQATSGAASYDGFGGGVPAAKNYIEDVFSTYLYTGTNANITINNGIDLATYGGLTWFKSRSGAFNNALLDTARGTNKALFSNSTAANSTFSYLTSFNTNGVTFPGGFSVNNNSGATYALWTFREQPKFFDVVTWTGNGASTRTISHSLGSVPGCVISKITSTTNNWYVYHRGLTSADYALLLNTTDAEQAGSGYTGATPTAPTATEFTVGGSSTNANGATYVAYLFAHNAGGFGLTGTDNVISCGSYSGNNTTPVTVTLGYEPQWILIKRTDLSQDWTLYDNMRGIVTGGADPFLRPNTSDLEVTAQNWISVTATGFQLDAVDQQVNVSGSTYIYIAIRRGPMKVPTSGTSVFSPVARTGTSASANVTAGFAPDLLITDPRATGDRPRWWDRLRGANLQITSNNTNAENTATDAVNAFNNTTLTLGADVNNLVNQSGSTYINWIFSRAPSFFDEVCYTGTGAGQVVSHNLGVVPQLMIFKCRSTAGTGWIVTNAFTGYMSLNLTTAQDSTTPWDFNGTAPTATQLTTRAASNGSVNAVGSTYVAYLFATCAGVSKVGSYTGNGSSQTINCGFTGGARFVLIKCTSTTGDWYVWDTARGIIAANDPHLSLNTTVAEVTTDDTIDTDNTGFIVNQVAATNVNVTSATYIFLAIA